MIYVLYGTDTAKSRNKLSKLISTLLSKKPDAMLVRANSEDFKESFLEEHVQSQGLFEQKSIVVLDTIFENKVYKDIVLKKLKELQASNNVFVLLEVKLDAKSIEKLTKYSAKVQECSLPKTKEKKFDFNIFELSDALGARNRKKLWVIYQEGKMHNISDEEMHGILFWGTKNMLLCKKAKSATEAGLSSFVYRKAKSQSKNYSENELANISRALVQMYHHARRGQVSLTIAFERFILGLQ